MMRAGYFDPQLLVQSICNPSPRFGEEHSVAMQYLSVYARYLDLNKEDYLVGVFASLLEDFPEVKKSEKFNGREKAVLDFILSNSIDTSLIEKIYDFAEEKYKDLIHPSGELYLEHVLEVTRNFIRFYKYAFGSEKVPDLFIATCLLHPLDSAVLRSSLKEENILDPAQIKELIL